MGSLLGADKTQMSEDLLCLIDDDGNSEGAFILICCYILERESLDCLQSSVRQAASAGWLGLSWGAVA